MMLHKTFHIANLRTKDNVVKRAFPILQIHDIKTIKIVHSGKGNNKNVHPSKMIIDLGR